jgi:hypothetical protein
MPLRTSRQYSSLFVLIKPDAASQAIPGTYPVPGEARSHVAENLFIRRSTSPSDALYRKLTIPLAN